MALSSKERRQLYACRSSQELAQRSCKHWMARGRGMKRPRGHHSFSVSSRDISWALNTSEKNKYVNVHVCTCMHMLYEEGRQKWSLRSCIQMTGPSQVFGLDLHKVSGRKKQSVFSPHSLPTTGPGLLVAVVCSLLAHSMPDRATVHGGTETFP